MSKVRDTQRFCNELINLYVENQVPFANRINKKIICKMDQLQPMPKRVREVSLLQFRRIHLCNRILFKALRAKELNFKAYGQSIRDFFFFLILFWCNCILFAYFHPLGHTYYSSEVMSHILINNTYTGSQGFANDVNNYNE